MKRLNKYLLVIICLFYCSSLGLSVEYLLRKPTKVVFLTKDKMEIAGTYYPVESAKPPGVLLLHMLGRNRGDWNSFARYLQKEGIAVLSIDLRGHGESTNSRTVSWYGFGEVDYVNILNDVEAAHQIMIDELGIDPEKFGILGMSLGANVAIKYAATYSPHTALGIISPGLNYRGVDISAEIEQLRQTPIFIMCSRRDGLAMQVVSLMRNSNFERLKVDIYDAGLNTLYLFFGKPNMYNSVSSWFSGQLLQNHSK